jgi:hypothetical protein
MMFEEATRPSYPAQQRERSDTCFCDLTLEGTAQCYLCRFWRSQMYGTEFNDCLVVHMISVEIVETFSAEHQLLTFSAILAAHTERRLRTAAIFGVLAVESPLSERLKAVTDELKELEKLVLAGDLSPRILSEFRSAVDSIRQTAWAVQQWTELQQQNRDPYTVLGILSEERVRRTTQIARDLRLDLESLELDLKTEGLTNLFEAIEGLYERLTPLFKKK